MVAVEVREGRVTVPPLLYAAIGIMELGLHTHAEGPPEGVVSVVEREVEYNGQRE